VLGISALALLGALVVYAWPSRAWVAEQIFRQFAAAERIFTHLVAKPAALVHLAVGFSPAPGNAALPRSQPTDTSRTDAVTSDTVAAHPAFADTIHVPLTLLPTVDTTRPPEPAAHASPSDSTRIVLQPKWAKDWANVRQRPDANAPILQMLRPGTRVDGRAGENGWWLVFINGDSVGYVAGALLTSRGRQRSASIR
jgi:hypothetical protein